MTISSIACPIWCSETALLYIKQRSQILFHHQRVLVVTQVHKEKSWIMLTQWRRILIMGRWLVVLTILVVMNLISLVAPLYHQMILLVPHYRSRKSSTTFIKVRYFLNIWMSQKGIKSNDTRDNKLARDKRWLQLENDEVLNRFYPVTKHV